MTFKSKLPLSSYTFALALSAVFAGAPFAAHAGDFLSDLDNAAAPILDKDGTVTKYGVTLYGAYDINGNYQSHGADLSGSFPQTTNYEVQPTGNKANWVVAGNGLSQTNLGLKGNIPTTQFDTNVVFNLNAGINPLNGTLADGAKSLVQNSGAAYASTTHATQSGSAIGLGTPDSGSSRAGQLFNGAAWGGINNPLAGQITFGRHTTLLSDAVVANDPFAGSYAFSLVGFSSTAQGGGSGEEARYDRSLRYSNKYGPVRFAAMYQLEGAVLRNGGDDGYQFDLGGDYAGATVDLLYSHKNDQVKTSALSATGATGTSFSQASASAEGLNPLQTIGASLYDTQTWGLYATYKPVSAVKTFIGYEYIRLSNPHNASSITQGDLGDWGKYSLLLNTAATGASLDTYNKNGVMQYMWIGANYNLTNDLKLIGAAYYLLQNDAADSAGLTIAGTNGSTTKLGAGQEAVFSVAADYLLTKRLDFYTGISYSQVGGGLDLTNKANGYQYNNQLLALGGLRFRF